MSWQSVTDIVCRQINSPSAFDVGSSRLGGSGKSQSAGFGSELASLLGGEPVAAPGASFGFQKSVDKFIPDSTVASVPGGAGVDSALALREELEAQESGKCLLSFNGKQVDIGGNLLEIARTDFKKFREILQKLESSEPADMLAALSEITGIPQADIQQTLRDMDEEELKQFATDLASVIGGTGPDVLHKLNGIKNLELTAEMVDEKLQSMAAEDFWEFYDLLQKLRSDDAGDTLKSLSELLGLSEEDTQRYVELMDPQKLEAIAMTLSRASQASASIQHQQLLESTELEVRAWEKAAELDEDHKKRSRLESVWSGRG